MTVSVMQEIRVEIEALQHKLDQLLETFESTQSYPHQPLVRLEIDCVYVSLLELMNQQSFETAFYFQGREEKYCVAGLGVADRKIQHAQSNVAGVMQELKGVLGANKQARYIGALSFFNTSYQNSPWESFGVYQFVLPRFEFTQAERTTLAVQVLISKKTDIAILRQQVEMDFSLLKESLTSKSCHPPKIVLKAHSPNLETWQTAVTEAKAEMAQGRYQKIVLARKTSFQLTEKGSGAAILQALQPFSKHAYSFLFQPQKNHAFISISPERLFKRNQRMLETEAIAGTHAGSDEDSKIGATLSQNAKAQIEHHHVVHMIQETLQPLCVSLSCEPQEILDLTYVHHLRDGIKGVLNSFVDDAQIIKALHPTPAVGGYPTAITQALLKEREPFERGWYAGVFGWVSAEESEWAVGIRSARLIGTQLDVFTGAGIVADSDPEEEWQELEAKMRPFKTLV